MWTKLWWAELPHGFNVTMKDGLRQRAVLSGRYKGVLRKEFRRNGMPWLFEPPKDHSKNPRHKMPKEKKYIKINQNRYEMIKKKLEQNEEAETKFRQKVMNARRLSYQDFIFQKAVPSVLQKKDYDDDVSDIDPVGESDQE